MNTRLALALSTLFSITLELGCSTSAKQPMPVDRAKTTTVLILIDGLSIKILQGAFAKHPLTGLRQHFLSNRATFQVARAAFPTLTYPNIASILTVRGLNEHPITGNTILLDGEKINFESPTRHSLLERVTAPLSIFAILENQNRTTASFSYAFGRSATHHNLFGLREGLEYQRSDFGELDDRLISKFETFLRETDLNEWPEFIYLHLIGVDGFAHQYGPESPVVFSYLEKIDERLSKSFGLLVAAEKRDKTVITLLTSDHGFTETPASVDIESVIQDLVPGVTTINEHRFISLYLPEGKDPQELEPMLSRISKMPGVGMTISRPGKSIRVLAPSTSGKASLDPFFEPNLTTYFQSQNHPTALVMAAPGYAFTKDNRGNHGGLTPDELFVPIMLRNATLSRPGELVATSTLLKFVEKLPRRRGIEVDF